MKTNVKMSVKNSINAKHPNLPDFLQKKKAKLKTGSPDGFLEHLFGKINEHISQNGRVLILTLTKKSSEEVTSFLISK